MKKSVATVALSLGLGLGATAAFADCGDVTIASMNWQSAEVLAALDAPAAIPMRHATPHFAHVFTGDGYSSGYYSYLWSEVMDADAFEAFVEAGDIFDPETAQKLEKSILSRGGSLPADQLWTEFRERMPGVAPLLTGRGLI